MVSTPLKNVKVNWDDDIPDIWENNKCFKPPTRGVLFIPGSKSIMMKNVSSPCQVALFPGVLHRESRRDSLCSWKKPSLDHETSHSSMILWKKTWRWYPMALLGESNFRVWKPGVATHKFSSTNHNSAVTHYFRRYLANHNDDSGLAPPSYKLHVDQTQALQLEPIGPRI